MYKSKEVCRGNHSAREALAADADELLLLAEKVPERIRRRVLDRPDAFRRFTDLNDRQIDELLGHLDAAGE